MKQTTGLRAIVGFALFGFSISMHSAPLPRNMSLTAFDPHRQTFVCVREGDVVPPIDPEAAAWLQEGLRVTSYGLPSEDRNFPKAVQLWAQAAQRNHWKAMLNLAGVFSEGRGKGQFAVQADTERAVQIIERAMQLKIPAAFDAMGTFHDRGVGVKRDASRAFALWQLAAEMGSADAQAHIGKSLLAGYDDPKQRFWSNVKVAKAMLECAVSQGSGAAALAYATHAHAIDDDLVLAVNLLHLGTRLGCQDCASDLGVLFREGTVPGGVADVARADRYWTLGNALYYNRDLRFPNLDKILPLPPAPLPKWDGDKDKLIDAAKAVVPIPPKPPASAASQRTGRAHMPEGYVLPAEPQHTSAPRYESTNAGLTGYWLPQLVHSSTLQHAAWNSSQVPLRYDAHETFESARQGLEDADGRVVFHYLGVPVAAPPMHALEHPAASRGIARAVAMPAPYVALHGDAGASQSGIWLARLANDHPRAAVFNHWSRQRYMTKGEAFPILADAPVVERSELTWYCCGQSNEERGEGWSWVRLNDTDTYRG